MTGLKQLVVMTLAIAALSAMFAIAPPTQSDLGNLPQGIALAQPPVESVTPPAGATKASPTQASPPAAVPAEPPPPLPLELFNCADDLSILAPGQPGQMPRLPGEALSSDALAQAIAVARDLDPDLARKLSNLCAEQPTQFEQMIRNSGQRLVAMGELKQRDPQLYGYKLSELRHEMQVRKLTGDLSRALAAKDESQARVIEEQLRTILRLQLALSIKARAEYLCRLEQHIQKVKDEIAREAADFNLTVEKRYQEALAQAGEKPATKADAAQPVSAKTVELTPQVVPAAPR